jgi:hypothetical protein
MLLLIVPEHVAELAAVEPLPTHRTLHEVLRLVGRRWRVATQTIELGDLAAVDLHAGPTRELKFCRLG